MHETEAEKLSGLKQGKSREEQERLNAAACALVKCADGVPSSDPYYSLLKGMQEYSATHPHLKLLEDNWQIIRDEYLAAANMVTEWPETYLHNGLWDVLGIHYPDHQMPGESLCPRTRALVQQIPGLLLAGFSILRPGCVVVPHVGAVEGVWRSHLGLICPPEAWLEVLGERHVAQDGKVAVFDDRNLHSAGNQGESERVVLIVDFWKTAA